MIAVGGESRKLCERIKNWTFVAAVWALVKLQWWLAARLRWGLGLRVVRCGGGEM